MELNEETVQKALECCGGDIVECQKCAYVKKGYPKCKESAAQDALSLINELTQANEQLSESYDHLENTKDELLAERSRLIMENERLHASCTEFERKCASLNDENERLKQKRMNKIDIYKALDILDKFDFFQGQRAGRELWSEKPFEVQEEDLKNFSMDVELLKDFVEDIAHKLKCAELQIEAKERICESYMLQYGTAADKEVWLKKERADTVQKFKSIITEKYAVSKVHYVKGEEPTITYQ
jgi:hypothetical protein